MDRRLAEAVRWHDAAPGSMLGAMIEISPNLADASPARHLALPRRAR